MEQILKEVEVMEELKVVNTKRASKILGISEQGLRLGLQQNKFPFGVAVKHHSNYEYYIFRKRLERYLKGEL